MVLGFFGLFGRSEHLKRLDQALREVGVHPLIVPDAVKLTTVKLLGEAGAGRDPAASGAAAALLGYCVLGAKGFAEENGAGSTESVERRLEDALEAGDSCDARLVLLALHAGIVQASVVERYDLGTD